MLSPRYNLTAAAVAVLVAGSWAVPPAAAQANCDWYAKTALRQQQDNEQRKCGFTGPGWSSDLRSHMAWCAANAPDAWKSEAQRREQQLSACKK
jgi:hypothetical protein